MAVTTFLAVGLCSALALCLAAVLLAGLVVMLSAIVRVVGVMAAIVREERDRVTARARDRWSNALKGRW